MHQSPAPLTHDPSLISHRSSLIFPHNSQLATRNFPPPPHRLANTCNAITIGGVKSHQNQSSFDIPGVRMDSGRGGLSRIVIQTDLAEAEVYLHGAHVTSFKPAGAAEVLFVSGQSAWTIGKPIRGGVPICFPWFGPKADNPNAPMHGFARLREWAVESIERHDDGAIEIVLMLTADDATRALWNAEFVLRHRLVIGQTLSMTLEVENRGDRPIHFEEALHTYFAVADVRQVAVTGLEQTEYIDKTDNLARKRQDEQPIRIEGETDRMYLNTRTATMVANAHPGVGIRIDKIGSDSTVVWNPWINKSKSMPDFGDEEWPGMLCVETVNANQNAVTLPPGQCHQMNATISLVC